MTAVSPSDTIDQIDSFLTAKDFDWPGSDFARVIIPLVLPAKRCRSSKSVWDYRYFQTFAQGLCWTTDDRYFWKYANPLMHLLRHVHEDDYQAKTPQEQSCFIYYAGVKDEYFWNAGCEYRYDYAKLWAKIPHDFGANDNECRSVSFDHLIKIYHYQAEHSSMDLDEVNLDALMTNDTVRRKYVEDFMIEFRVKDKTLDQLDTAMVQLYQKYKAHL
jgi:hypothetical protein